MNLFSTQVFQARMTLAASTMAAISILSGAGLAQASSVLHADHQYFKDEQGRAVFLRGVNLSGDVKLFPFLPLQSATEAGKVDFTLLDPLKTWGFNTLRLLFIWEAYEPQPGQYNEAYLQRITEIADEAWARGIYVIVDMHQDAFSHYLSDGCGEGFPSWVVPERYRRNYSYAPTKCGPTWAMKRALSPDMHHSYGAFYSDLNGVRTAYVNLWSKVARHFSTHPGVIGYDLLNEPWGNERKELAPLYEDLAKVVRAEDPSAILFVEPSVMPHTFGVSSSALPKPTFGNFAYAGHFYDPIAIALKSWAHWRSGITRRGFRLMKAKAQQLDAPLFVGEFGAAANSTNGRWFSDYQYDQLDTSFLSSAQWNYTPGWTPEHLDGWNGEDLSIVDGHGNLRDNFYPRPSVRAIAGDPVSQHELRFGNGDLDRYELEWKPAQNGGDTVVFVPSYVVEHPEQYEIKWSGAEVDCGVELKQAQIVCNGAGAGDVAQLIIRKLER